MILNRQERETWSGLKYPERRRNKWLFGRWAAKDAIRNYLNKFYGMSLCPVDIEIVTDEFGRPSAQGKWKENIKQTPEVSIAHCDDLTIAIAGVCTNGQRLGVDIERIRVQQPGFEKHAFMPEERTILESVDESDRAEWVMRFWCAKEATAKALGRGFLGNPYNLLVKEINSDTGKIMVAIRGELAEIFPEYTESSLIVYTVKDGDYVIATSLCERS